MKFDKDIIWIFNSYDLQRFYRLLPQQLVVGLKVVRYKPEQFLQITQIVLENHVNMVSQKKDESLADSRRGLVASKHVDITTDHLVVLFNDVRASINSI